MNHDDTCACIECARARAYLAGARITIDEAALARIVAGLLAPDHLDPFEALCDELGDALFELPDDAGDRLIWWRATVCWVAC